MNTRYLISIFFFTFVIGSHMSAQAQLGLGEANGSLSLRTNPPSGLFYKKGSQIGTISKGERFIVEDRTEVDTLFGAQEWLKVHKMSSEKADAAWSNGWIYNGSRMTKKGTFEPYVGMIQVENPNRLRMMTSPGAGRLPQVEGALNNGMINPAGATSTVIE